MTTTTTNEIQTLATYILIERNGVILDTVENRDSIRSLIKLGAVKRAFSCIPVPYVKPTYCVVPGYEKYFLTVEQVLSRMQGCDK